LTRSGSIERILDAFEATGWPSRIADPVAKGRQQEELRQFIFSLNQGLEVIRFHVREAGRAITWTRL